LSSFFILSINFVENFVISLQFRIERKFDSIFNFILFSEEPLFKKLDSVVILVALFHELFHWEKIKLNPSLVKQSVSLSNCKHLLHSNDILLCKSRAISKSILFDLPHHYFSFLVSNSIHNKVFGDFPFLFDVVNINLLLNSINRLRVNNSHHFNNQIINGTISKIFYIYIVNCFKLIKVFGL